MYLEKKTGNIGDNNAIWKVENRYFKGMDSITSRCWRGCKTNNRTASNSKNASGAYEDFDIIKGGELIQRQVKKTGI